jgi:putative tryptophan/tyrosine transport system substrate-binding protein
MRRRDMIIATGAVALRWPRAAGAEGPPHRIGVMSAGGERSVPQYDAFDARMRELGYADGRNLAVIFRSAEGHAERLPQIAAEVVGERPEAIVAVGPEATLRAVHAATTSIPIIMVAVDYDPVARGYVAGLARPGGNITGVFAQQIELAAKRLEILTQTLPAVKRIGVLSDEFSVDQLHAVETAAPGLGVALDTMELHTPPYDFAPALTGLRNRGAGAVLTLMSPVFFLQRAVLADGLLRANPPASFGVRDYPEAGGLVSYGASVIGMLRRAAEYVDKIVKGAKPADLPIEQPTRFEFVINLKTAAALGLTVPQSLLARADEVIG